jgi:hypothetical protein
MAHFPRSFVALGVVAWLCVGSLSACNSVLGIEEAAPRANGASGAPAGSAGGTGISTYVQPPNTGNVCTKPVSGDCSTCIAKNCSASELSTTLANPDSRAALGKYSICLGAACSSQDTCFEDQLLVAPAPVFKCGGNCISACATTPVFSTCQLYCACMAQNCVSEDAGFANPDQTDCVTRCEAWPAEVQTCRWSHCEVAPLDPATHCQHADGKLISCGATTPIVRPDSCKTLSLPGFGCNGNGDCCNNDCSPTHICN